MDEEVFMCQMYAVQPFALDLRRAFQLPEDPYQEDESLRKEALEYLQSLGVFFYRDEDHSEGVMIPPSDGDPTPMWERSGFKAYKYGCLVQAEDLAVAGWENPDSRYVKKAGDDRAWIHWEKVVNVVRVERERIVLS